MLHNNSKRLAQANLVLMAANYGDLVTINSFIDSFAGKAPDQADRMLMVSAYLTAEEHARQDVMQRLLSVPGILALINSEKMKRQQFAAAEALAPSHHSMFVSNTIHRPDTKQAVPGVVRGPGRSKL